MSESSNDKDMLLLMDIAKLIKKYGIDTFETLANTLIKPEFTMNLHDILITLADNTRRLKLGNKDNQKSGKNQSLRSKIMDIQKNQPEKGRALIQLYDRLMSKRILPTLNDVREFAINNGLEVAKDTTRSKAVNSLVENMLELSIDSILALNSKIKSVINDDDRSLEGWSEVILGNKERMPINDESMKPPSL